MTTNHKLKIKESIKYDSNYEKQQVKLIEHIGLNMYDYLRKHKATIAGGMITSLFTGNDINDVDLYFKDEIDAISLLRKLQPFITNVSEKSISFEVKEVKYQIVKLGKFKSINDIFDKFDFTVCMGAFDFETEKFCLHDEFLVNNINKELVFNKDTLYPIISLLRVNKYIKKGYSISNSELIKLSLSISELNITTYEELKNHIGGMYGDIIFEFNNEEDKPFKISDVIDSLSNERDYIYEKEKNTENNNMEFIIEDWIKTIGKVMKSNHILFAELDGYYFKVNNPSRTLIEKVEVNIDKEITVYKYVKKTSSNGLFSIFKDSFEYKLNEIIKDEFGLYFNTEKELTNSSYHFKAMSDDIVILKCKVNLKDLKTIKNESLVFTQCIPVEVIEGTAKIEFLNIK